MTSKAIRALENEQEFIQGEIDDLEEQLANQRTMLVMVEADLEQVKEDNYE